MGIVEYFVVLCMLSLRPCKFQKYTNLTAKRITLIMNVLSSKLLLARNIDNQLEYRNVINRIRQFFYLLMNLNKG